MQLDRPLILASSSPRRQHLMREVGFAFTIEKPQVEEAFPADLPIDQVARYLAAIKAEYFRPKMREQILVAADTVVILEGQVLNKPENRQHAIQMLSSLSGRTHRVMTGVSILSKEREESFEETTYVTFEKLSRAEIESYIDQFKPYDKAGSYGAQDCLPPNMNPCSREELEFLRSIENDSLIKRTITPAGSGGGIAVIREIQGSYFNVMGFPIHKVYQHLKTWTEVNPT